ncbi:MAG: hypothetical protein ACYC9M_06310 [Desulfobulbaceae bacterium]
MKKFLSTALALGVVAGLAATASAMELKVTGRYVVDGYYIDAGNGLAGKPNNGVVPFDLNGTEPDSWYEHAFITNPDLIINDKITMKTEIRFIDRATVWGGQDDGSVDDGRNFSVDKAWLVYDSPVGKWEIGRRPAGAWQGAFVNSSTHADRIMWNFPVMAGFKSYIFTEKQIEQDGYKNLYTDGNYIWLTNEENTDKDYYEAAAGYEVEGVKAWLGLGYLVNNNNDVDLSAPTYVWYGSQSDMWRVKGYGEFNINQNFSLATEFDYKSGTVDSNHPLIADKDSDGLAFIASAIGKFDALSASLHYAYISGDDQSSGDNEAYDAANGMGWDFEPLYILTGNATNILNGYRGANTVGSVVRNAGAHAVVALADYAVSEDLTLHGGVGWGMADEPDQRIGFDALGRPIMLDVDDEYGWEFDLGLAYKLYTNLTYELHFGWWAVGDFAEVGGLFNTEDVFLLSHHLSMKF